MRWLWRSGALKFGPTGYDVDGKRLFLRTVGQESEYVWHLVVGKLEVFTKQIF